MYGATDAENPVVVERQGCAWSVELPHKTHLALRRYIQPRVVLVENRLADRAIGRGILAELRQSVGLTCVDGRARQAVGAHERFDRHGIRGAKDFRDGVAALSRVMSLEPLDRDLDFAELIG